MKINMKNAAVPCIFHSPARMSVPRLIHTPLQPLVSTQVGNQTDFHTIRLGEGWHPHDAVVGVMGPLIDTPLQWGGIAGGTPANRFNGLANPDTRCRR